MSWSMIDGNYPYIDGLPAIVQLTAPYPFVAFRQAEDYPFLSSTPDLVQGYTSPYPATVFQIADDYPYLQDVQGVYGITEPYPVGVMMIGNSYPFLATGNCVNFGACCHATSLTDLTIPETVTSIGEYSFRNSAVECVKVCGGCSYSGTSFPDGCTVEYYEN